MHASSYERSGDELSSVNHTTKTQQPSITLGVLANDLLSNQALASRNSSARNLSWQQSSSDKAVSQKHQEEKDNQSHYYQGSVIDGLLFTRDQFVED